MNNKNLIKVKENILKRAEWVDVENEHDEYVLTVDGYEFMYVFKLSDDENVDYFIYDGGTEHQNIEIAKSHCENKLNLWINKLLGIKGEQR